MTKKIERLIRAIKYQGDTYLHAIFEVKGRYEDGSPKLFRLLRRDDPVLDGPDYVVGFIRGEILDVKTEGDN